MTAVAAPPAATGRVRRPEVAGVVQPRLPRAPRRLAALGVAIAVLFAAPMGFLVVRTVGLGGETVLETLTDDALTPLLWSLGLGAAVALSAAAIGVGLAWCTTRTDLPGRRAAAVLGPLPLVVPSYVGAAALVAGFAPGGLVADLVSPLGITPPEIGGFWGAWFVLSAFSYPYVYLPVAARLAELPPSLEESARLLGRGPRQVFTSVVLPQARTAVAAGTLLVFLYTISDFGAVSIMGAPTLTNEIFQAKLVPELWLPLASLLGAVALVVVAAERALARRRVAVSGVQVRRAMQVPLGRWRWPVALVVWGWFGAALAAPVLVLVLWVVRGVLGAGSPSATVLAPGGLLAPAASTVGVSVAAALATMALVLPIAYLTVRYRSRAGGTANTVVVGAFALPGLVVALALVFWTLKADALAWLYQTIPLLVFAYTVHFGAQGLRAAQVAVGSVPTRFDDAGAVLGASRSRRLRTIDLPLMARGLGAGLGLVLLSAMKELPATLLLAPPGFETLATRIWAASDSHQLAQLGVASLVLLALSGPLTWVLVIRPGRRR